MSKHAGRSGRRWRTLRTEFHSRCRAQDAPCWMCGQTINYDAPVNHPESFEVDHYYPVSTHPHLANDPSVLRASHSRCNRARGNTAPEPNTWVRTDF